MKDPTHIPGPHPGDLVSVMYDVSLWGQSYSVNARAGLVGTIEKGSLGVVIALHNEERLVFFHKSLGWVNIFSLALVVPR